MLAMMTLLHGVSAFQGASLATSSATRHGSVISNSQLNAATSLLPDFSALPTTSSNSNVQLRTYTHDGWTLKYRYKPAAKGKENEPPLLLVHPVGIGMSSWYWDEFMTSWNDGGAVYAPDLIGCGIDNGSDAWNPQERGLFFPLSWVKGCETLLQQVIMQSNYNNNNPLSSLLPQKKTVTVVTQGGLAPVGVMLAARNPDTVSRLVMSSPPTWAEMTTPVPEAELEKNYNFLQSNLGGVAFGALESEWAIRFFSNLFLFQGNADDTWMQECLQECRHVNARPPIQAFNAGLMQHRSYQEELTALSQPTTIVQGKGDNNRIPLRQEYETEMKDCSVVTLPEGLNVLPWESAGLFAKTVQEAQEKLARVKRGW
ncbi:expressed unknown protein [Seminavis robusta]|uniref:AB hydrolase-1 domain-containing protein n=1 Tax=Seminavis robusta TaxID=568900 RepID=A0A9N8H9N0_9STRA|nr:expressed unknown protein [Seminavis robusta]|eukprot:Sro197_g083850.1 n/a (371) ;mRNA; f:56326-57438